MNNTRIAGVLAGLALGLTVAGLTGCDATGNKGATSNEGGEVRHRGFWIQDVACSEPHKGAMKAEVTLMNDGAPVTGKNIWLTVNGTKMPDVRHSVGGGNPDGTYSGIVFRNVQIRTAGPSKLKIMVDTTTVATGTVVYKSTGPSRCDLS